MNIMIFFELIKFFFEHWLPKIFIITFFPKPAELTSFYASRITHDDFLTTPP